MAKNKNGLLIIGAMLLIAVLVGTQLMAFETGRTSTEYKTLKKSTTLGSGQSFTASLYGVSYKAQIINIIGANNPYRAIIFKDNVQIETATMVEGSNGMMYLAETSSSKCGRYGVPIFEYESIGNGKFYVGFWFPDILGLREGLYNYLSVTTDKDTCIDIIEGQPGDSGCPKIIEYNDDSYQLPLGDTRGCAVLKNLYDFGGCGHTQAICGIRDINTGGPGICDGQWHVICVDGEAPSCSSQNISLVGGTLDVGQSAEEGFVTTLSQLIGNCVVHEIQCMPDKGGWNWQGCVTPIETISEQPDEPASDKFEDAPAGSTTDDEGNVIIPGEIDNGNGFVPAPSVTCEFADNCTGWFAVQRYNDSIYEPYCTSLGKCDIRDKGFELSETEWIIIAIVIAFAFLAVMYRTGKIGGKRR